VVLLLDLVRRLMLLLLNLKSFGTQLLHIIFKKRIVAIDPVAYLLNTPNVLVLVQLELEDLVLLKSHDEFFAITDDFV
jgi:hypothetical protein